MKDFCEKYFERLYREVAFHYYIPMLYRKGLVIEAMQLSTYTDDLRVINNICLMAMTLKRDYGFSLRSSLKNAKYCHKKDWPLIENTLIEIERSRMPGKDPTYFSSIQVTWDEKKWRNHQRETFKELVARGFIPKIMVPFEAGKFYIDGSYHIIHPRLFDSKEEAKVYANLVCTRGFAGTIHKM